MSYERKMKKKNTFNLKDEIGRRTYFDAVGKRISEE